MGRARRIGWAAVALVLALAILAALWAIDVDEPLVEDPRVYADRVVREARPGSILLMHLMYRANGAAREALPLVIRGLQARGLRIVYVGELLAAAGRDGLPAALGQR